MKFEGLPGEHHGNDIRSDLEGVGVNRMAVKRNCRQAVFSFEFHDVFSRALCACELNLELDRKSVV